MGSIEVSEPPSKRLSPKRSNSSRSFKLSLPGLFCGHCKATAVSSPPDSPTAATGARSLSSSSASASASASSSSSGTSRGGRDRMAELLEIFRHFDRDMDGRISGAELREFFASMGDNGGSLALGLKDGGEGDHLTLGFDDFVRIVESKGGEEEEREDLRRAFEAFEAVKGSGRITPRGLQRVLSQLGDEPSVAECEAMIRAYDDDGDGELDFHDFHRMMSQD
ncbi:putative calcium-binding protein CML19 [Miscanthus floridulus]|uniref:putative calcium-binding protein CML19 n=1 Tax=Miscanthus floridulus TaxID=154761 RepID=UPI003458A001